MTGPHGGDAGRLEGAIARWLADRGMPDPGAGAAELLHMVRGHGWRPIPALQREEPAERQPAQALPPEYLAVKAALTQKGTPDGS